MIMIFLVPFNKYLISNKQVPGDSVEAIKRGKAWEYFPWQFSTQNNFMMDQKNSVTLIIKLSKDLVYSLRA